ncbi:Hypothetical predicted protein [Paramuricea clavata]|uniref:Uncharacterized protein n=1 Tax=Paramuricea clavata TaxID=317549 RepID=A0A6S7FLP9_PARCT|nr:Hypothetical predicted protein [Paramuricea clavata]
MSYNEFKTLQNKPKFKQSKTKPKAYNGGDVQVQANSSNNLTGSRYNNAKLSEKYADCFEGLGCLPHTVRIELRDDATPVVEPCRTIPFAQYNKLKDELQRMEAMGVIEKIEEPTEWVNSFVPVTKPNRNLRVCLDPRNLNKSIKREHFKLPTRDEVIAQFAIAKVFTKLDASNGFWQMKLEDGSTNLCTFNTTFGRYKYLDSHLESPVPQRFIIERLTLCLVI